MRGVGWVIRVFPQMLCSAQEIPNLLWENQALRRQGVGGKCCWQRPPWGEQCPPACWRLWEVLRKKHTLLRCLIKHLPKFLPREFCFFTQHLLMFLQHTRKCWMKQYIHFGFEFFFIIIGLWILILYAATCQLWNTYYLFSLSGSRSHCAGKGPFILWGEVIVFSQHTVEEPFVFNVFLLQVRAVLIRFGS